MKPLFLFWIVMLSSGCSSLGYYWQAVNGHAELLNGERPISEILADKTVKPELKRKLQQAQAIRRFASSELHLPDNNSYTQYVDLHRPYAIWNVVATPRFSIKPKQWCFLVVGCISYRGYYRQQDAVTYARSLKLQGYDVMVSGARAYSTLGWMEDPLLNTMLYKNKARLAGIIFHELAHQKVYKKGFSSFNEAFAMTVEYEGVIKWLASIHDQAAITKYRRDFKHQLQFNQLLRATRKKLRQLYRLEISDTKKLAKKQQIFNELRTHYHQLKQQWNGDTSYDAWMSQNLNNAFLALVGTYYDDIPFFRNLLQKNRQDFARFYQIVNGMTGEEVSAQLQVRNRLASAQ